MICPYCKNEKFEAAACPRCGLGEQEALKKAASLCEAEGRWETAADLYGRYLAAEPGDFGTACRRALLLSTMARNWRDEALFKEADRQLSLILQDHWDWAEGHQNRVDLYYCFGWLETLLKEYAPLAPSDPQSARVLELIRLVQRFRNEKPPVPEALEGEEESTRIWKSFWPFLAGLAGAVAFFTFFRSPAPATNDAGGPEKFRFMEQLFVGLFVLGLAFFGLWRYQKGQKGPKKTNPGGEPPAGA